MKRLFILIYLISFTIYLNANEFKINAKEDSSNFYTYFEYFKDTKGLYHSQNLEALSKETFFKASRKEEHLGLSFQTKTLWGRFGLFNDSAHEQTKVLWLKNITYENISLYEKSGSSIEKIELLNDFYFRLTIEPHSHKEYYVKFKANGPYIVDTELMSVEESTIFTYKNGFFFAAFTTFMFVAIMFYFALFIEFKQRMYLYFGLHSLSHLLLWLGMYGVYRPLDFSLIKVISLSSSSIFIALVSFDFLKMRENMRRLYYSIIFVLGTLFGYYIFAFYLELSVFQPMVFAIFYFVIYLLISIAIVKAVMNKQKAALYFLFAIVGYFLGYNITIGGTFASGTLQANNFTLYIGMLGTIMDVVFVSLAFINTSKNVYTAQQRKIEEYSQSLELKVKERTQKIEEQNILLQKLSSTDTLTQLDNRLELDRKVEALYKSQDETLYLILVDIDFFKRINDNYGHLVGDSVLKQVARILRKSLKEKDTVGRWGGEEFLIVLKAKSEEEVFSIAQRVRKNIELDGFEEGIKITISLGISSLKNANSIAEWIHKSDEALYKAKESGRNRVVIQK